MLFAVEFDVLVILIPLLIFSLSIHEFSHGYVAYLLGDNTAAYAGRLTLNPLAHLDPMGSLMLLFIGFGYAKPVPVNPINFKDKENINIGMMKVAFAGPASNLILCLMGCLIIRFIGIENITEIVFNKYGRGLDFNSLGLTLYLFSTINMILAIFNLIPIHPLDGGQIFGAIISKNNPEFAWKLQTYGPQVLLGIILFGIISGYSIIGLIMEPFQQLVLILAGLR